MLIKNTFRKCFLHDTLSYMEFCTKNIEAIIITILILINVFSFIVMARDKGKAVHKNNEERTPEGIMFFLCAIWGSVGVYLGMLVFRHKTRTWYFQLGMPLLIVQNIATISLFSSFIESAFCTIL